MYVSILLTFLVVWRCFPATNQGRMEVGFVRWYIYFSISLWDLRVVKCLVYSFLWFVFLAKTLENIRSLIFLTSGWVLKLFAWVSLYLVFLCSLWMSLQIFIYLCSHELLIVVINRKYIDNWRVYMCERLEKYGFLS